jgi:FMN reductase
VRATVVVGNPKLGSRTRAAGVALAEAVIAGLVPDAGRYEVVTIELAALGSTLFAWGDEGVAAAKATVLDSDLLVFASPVYKASYTGLLKAFLDQFARDELGAIATVPLMVGASPAHSLAVEMQLRPVLVEIGASCPTRGVYLLESEIAELTLDDWLAIWGPALTAVMQSPHASRRTR